MRLMPGLRASPDGSILRRKQTMIGNTSPAQTLSHDSPGATCGLYGFLPTGGE
jgi:hypothetical protein